MSDLQISLLVIGIVVVGAVYLFNWAQERKLRRKLEKAFGAEHDDVLLRSAPPVAGDGRTEPQLQPAEDLPAEPAPAPIAMTSESLAPAPDLDSALDFVARIDAGAAISDGVIAEMLSRIAVCGKPVRGVGFDPDTGQWEDLGRSGGNRYARLCLALQLVNRSGPASPAQLAAFCDAVRSSADKIPAAVDFPDSDAALKRAHDLDSFCAEVDVAIGINIVAPTGAMFSGTQIRSLAESAGFKLEPEGVFHFRNDGRQTLFTLDNHEPAPFIPEQVKSLSTSGITLLLDVPRVADGQSVLDRMIEIGMSFARSLGGQLVDDNRAALTEPGIAKIKRQLAALYAQMEARGIRAGSERALRLFS
jgi:hypothetical protein